MDLRIFTAGPLDTNALVVACSQTRKGIIIDAPFGVTSQILPFLSAHSIEILFILLTHSHWDHIADVVPLKRQLPHARLAVHPDDANNLLHPGSDGLPTIPIDAATPAWLFNDGEAIHVGEMEFKVIHTPGHSPGSVCFYSAAEGLLSSGDTVFKGTYGSLSLPTAVPEQMALSLRKVALLPPQTRIIPGHGPATTVGQEGWLKQYI